MTAFHHFEAGLQRDLDPPTLGLTQFIKQVQIRQASWFQVYAGYGSSSKPPILRPPNPQQTQQSQQTRSQSYYPTRPPQRQITAGPSYRPPSQPRAYWTGYEKEENYTYDAPSDTYVVVPEHQTHPPGHTPRR